MEIPYVKTVLGRGKCFYCHKILVEVNYHMRYDCPSNPHSIINNRIKVQDKANDVILGLNKELDEAHAEIERLKNKIYDLEKAFNRSTHARPSP